MDEELKKTLKEAIADDEFFDLMAQGMKKFERALIKAGFNDEEAVRIVVKHGMGFSVNS
jgi:NADH/NAD ratio-sensing transcriptional regulator Rex